MPGMFGLPPDSSLYLDVHGASKHFGTDVKYNETNPGFGLTYEWDRDKNLVKLIKIGQYLNSINKTSNYVGGGVKKRILGGDDGYMDVGVLGGLVSGYYDKPVPAVFPQLSIGNKNFGLNILAAPPVPNVTPATLMFSTSFPIK